MQYPKLIGTRNNTYKLVEDYTIVGITIPAKDFETDYVAWVNIKKLMR